MSLIRACVPVNTYCSIFGTWGFPTEVCVIGLLSNDGPFGSCLLHPFCDPERCQLCAEFSAHDG